MRALRASVVILGATLILAGCTADPLRRHRDEFPPKVQKDAPDGLYPTWKGFVLKDGGIAWRVEF